MFLFDVACQKLLKSANALWSHSKNNTGTVFLGHGVELISGEQHIILTVFIESYLRPYGVGDAVSDVCFACVFHCR